MDGSLSFYFMFLFFIIYAFLGWVMEVVFHIFTDKKFINRGFLHGPVCPIYGGGAVLLIFFLTPLDDNILYLFIGGFIFATLLEYITGYVLELAFDTKWWDYTDEKFNIKGYVSLKFSLIWGLVAIFMMNVLQPRIAEIVYSMPGFILGPLYNIILIIFVIDTTLTLNSLIEFRKILQDLRSIKDEMSKKIKDEVLIQRKESIRIRLKSHHINLLKSYPKIASGKIDSIIKDIRNKAD